MNIKKKIYLDYNATTPVDNRVLEAMMPYFTEMFGNASSDHFFGWDANEGVEFAREKVSNLVNCKSSEIIFTSGATEAANLALFGFCKANSSKGKHIITCKTEHKAILDTTQALKNDGFHITYLDVDDEGNIDLEELERSINSETILVCLMLANNETGLIHPMKKIEKIVHEKDVKLMSDVTQAVGKLPLDLKELNLDLAIFSSHKLCGPKGAGALYINKKNKVVANQTVFGGGQEKGMRSGTLNVPAIVGFGKAAKIAADEMEEESIRISKLRDQFEKLLLEMEDVHINSKNVVRLPNTTNVSFKNIDGNLLFRKLNNLAISRGSACTSNLINPSHVLKAMGLSDERALSSIRISLGRNTTLSDIKFAAEEIKNTVHQLKKAVV